MGILFGGWISAEVSHWPIAFNSSILTFAIALGYSGVALFWSNYLRDKAELFDLLLLREEEEQEEEVQKEVQQEEEGRMMRIRSEEEEDVELKRIKEKI